MSGETGDVTSGWTVDTLHAHLRQQIADLRANLDERYATQKEELKAAFAAQEAATKAALAAQERATATRVVSDDRRFDLLNELRSGVATREQIDALAARFADLKERLDRGEGKASGANVDERLAELTKLLAASTNREAGGAGRSAGLHAGWLYLVGGVSLLTMIVSLVGVFAR